MPSSMNWSDGPAGGTPISAANLSKLAVTADIGTAGTPTGDALRAAYVLRGLVVDARDYQIGGTLTAVGVNAAITAAAAPGAYGKVLLPAGIIQVEQEIVMQAGVLIEGAGPQDVATRAGTEFVPASGYTGVGFHFLPAGAALWHGGGLRRFRVSGFTSHGIHIEGGIGEVSDIDGVFVKLCGGDGIRVEGPSTPANIGHIGVHANGGAGLRLVSQNQTHFQIGYLAGDNNAESLMTVDTLDTTSSVTVLGWKAERWNYPSRPYGHPNVFVINNANGGLVNLGRGRVQVGTGATIANAVVKQAATGGNSTGRVVVRYGLNDSSGTGGYTYGYQDTVTSTTYTVAQTSRRVLTIGEPTTVLSTTSATSAVTLAADVAGRGVYAGTINPNSNVVADPGSIYLREGSTTDGRVYRKITGTGNTGWEEMLSTDVSTVTTTAPSAGAAGALPATPAGYMTVFINGSARKVAYY